MWLVRELLESYHITGEQRYLEKAEYLMEYVLDGWDCTLDEQGNPLGGVALGPGYLTKHSCSNGPIVSPFWCWFHEIYKGKSDEVTYGYVVRMTAGRPHRRKSPTIIWVLPKPFMIGKRSIC